MNKRYKNLMKNTSMLGFGSVAAKVAQFIVLSMCTYKLSTAEFGIADICISTAALLVPLVCLNIFEAVFRFTISEENDKNSVLYIGVCLICLGIFLFLLSSPFAKYIPTIGEYWGLIAVLTILETLQLVVKEYTRGCLETTKYVISGMLNAILQIVVCFILLYVFDYGLWGYVFAVCSGYAIEVFYLWLALKLSKVLKIGKWSKDLSVPMLKFSIPLIPNSLMWWIVSISNRYFILYMIGEAATGIYSVAAKVPALITIVSNVFSRAWQMSAIDESKSSDRNQYYSDVFAGLWRFCVVGIGALLVFLKILLKILVAPEFQEAWRYAPFLILASGFSTMQSFIGTAYTVEKDSLGCLKTTSVMAVINLFLNCLLIRFFTLQGATLSTLISYVFVFIYRFFDTKKYFAIRIEKTPFICSFVCLFIEVSLLSYTKMPFYFVTLCSFCVILLINRKYIQSLLKIGKNILVGRGR